jgi:hypothetical protein
MEQKREFVIQIFENDVFTGRYVYHARKKYLGYEYDSTPFLKGPYNPTMVYAQIWKDKKKCDKACVRMMNYLEPWSRLKIYTLKTLEITPIKILRSIKLKKLKK